MPPLLNMLIFYVLWTKAGKRTSNSFPYMKWPSSRSYFTRINLLLQGLSANCWRNGMKSDKKITWPNLFSLRLSSHTKLIATEAQAARQAFHLCSPSLSAYTCDGWACALLTSQPFVCFTFLTAMDLEGKPNRFGNQFGPSRVGTSTHRDLGQCLPGH